MLDPSEKRLEFEGINGKSTGVQDQQKKSCAACGTTKTPLWRGGPAGPKSLCNACGIRSRKKRRDGLGLSRSSSNPDKKSRKGNSSLNSSSDESSNDDNGLEDGSKLRLLRLGGEVSIQRSSKEKQRRKLGEEEQAAVLLMALSYGSVYA